jgi:hypothetical protein
VVWKNKIPLEKPSIIESFCGHLSITCKPCTINVLYTFGFI